MTRARLDSLYLLMLGCVVFVLLGAVLERAAPAPLADFRVVYYPARCLLQHGDPYNENEVLRVYRAEGGDRPSETEKVRQIITRFIYFPGAFCLTIPFALLPWGPAHMLWMTLTVGLLILASLLIWNFGADDSPAVSGILAGFLLANSELIIITGNAAGIAISLCIVAVWCFLRERLALLGILCLAVSLAVKPQDSGLVWLYFLLAGGIYRKRALQTLAVTAVLSLPAVVWVAQVAPHWIQEWHSNMAAFTVHGGISDPGVTSSGGHGLDMLINLQTAISYFWDNPHIYNPGSYLVCGLLILVWAFTTLRSRPSPRGTWLALAAIAALSMLPVYHRQLDARLLLLTIPACAMLWKAGRLIGRIALLVNATAFMLTGDLTWAVFFAFIRHLSPTSAWLSSGLLTAIEVFAAPMILLATSIFYLWAYVRHGEADGSPRWSHANAERLSS